MSHVSIREPTSDVPHLDMEAHLQSTEGEIRTLLCHNQIVLAIRIDKRTHQITSTNQYEANETTLRLLACLQV
ncbi:Alanine racemase [Dissostichus eleginoides]|uniref:Alanine racemase n=1 Tax=Dissostichus eleginoides TaxID=100907 RepID=A0AAD9EVJ7_DISEL|nr:Alanine racemase [Dissostichus eleginoides]